MELNLGQQQHHQFVMMSNCKWKCNFSRTLQLLILFIALSPGYVHQTDGRQVQGGGGGGGGSHHSHSSSRNGGGGSGGGSGTHLLHSHGRRLHYSSFEELQRLSEEQNPFELNSAVNLTVPIGDSAFLRCKVRNLGERSVSWYRRRDWHILTTGKTTYTNDERFHVLHTDGSDEWTLQIKFVQKRDNGTYECQVSTGTGIVSYLVHLNIAVPEAFILGNEEYHVEQGSTINIVCIIEKSPKPPEFIFWYHNERMINYGNTREVFVHTEPGSKTLSRLTIRDARVSDTGNYTCKTANADPASIFVYVSQATGFFTGDKTAAIHRRLGDSSAAVSPAVLNAFLGLVPLFLSLQAVISISHAYAYAYSCTQYSSDSNYLLKLKLQH